MKTFNGDLPDEVLAVAAEGRVFEEPRDELVVLDFVDVLLLQGAVPLPVDHPLLGAFDVVELLVVVGPHVAAVGQIENKCFYFSKRSVPGWRIFFRQSDKRATFLDRLLHLHKPDSWNEMIVLRECESSTQTNVRKLECERERERENEKDERRFDGKKLERETENGNSSPCESSQGKQNRNGFEIGG